MRQQYSVTIVGAGPAGSATALHLIQSGIAPSDILLVDKACFPRPKLCGGGITNRGIAYLRALGPLPDGSSITTGLRFRSRFGDWQIKETGNQLLFDRSELDHQLLLRAEKAGVHVRQGLKLEKLRNTWPGWDLCFSDTSGERSCQFSTRWLVGADGAASAVRRMSGLGRYHCGGTGRLVEAVYRAGAQSRERRDTLYIDFDPIMQGIPGYGWVFPYPNTANRNLWKIGVMDGSESIGGATLRTWTDAYAASKGYMREDARIAGWPEHYYSMRNRAHLPNLVLVGESWGTDPLLGEGLAPSFAMAAYAAPRIASAIRKRRMVLPGYERRFAASIEGRNLVLQAWLAGRLFGPNGRQWLEKLYGLNGWEELLASETVAYGRMSESLFDIVGLLAQNMKAIGGLAALPARRLTSGYS